MDKNGSSTEPDVDGIVRGMLASYRSDARAQFINRRFLPSREEIGEVIQLFLQLFYPGYFGRQNLTDENATYHVGTLVTSLRDKLTRQIQLCLCHAAECGAPVDTCEDEARRIATKLLASAPELRTILIADVQAALDGDPAAGSIHEIILAYPGVLAVTVYRVAHELYRMGVPLLPRIMTEWAHSRTGADIHPGATIKKSFFIDH
ncbi:MAG: serine acetyltransferase, partial [Polyangiaceae bacterium]|nr:serine acetyltransferase [Polyangiaceae bacterium]